MARLPALTLALPLLALGGCTSAPAQAPNACVPALGYDWRFPSGSVDGHADPTGARAAGQARAGRITRAEQIRQPADAHAKVRIGDYLLANEHVSVYIEAAGASDGVVPYGGEILGLQPVDEAGLPEPISEYNETLLMLSRQVVAPDTVTVLADGSDGKAAIVRSSGVLENVPFLDAFGALFPYELNLPAALDYVLEPGAEKITLRLSLLNPDPAAVDLQRQENLGFFHGSRLQSFTPTTGFAEPRGHVPWIAFSSAESAFLWRQVHSDLNRLIVVSGFEVLQAEGLSLGACETVSVDYAELFPARSLDEALAAERRAHEGGDDWRPITASVRDAGGEPVAGAIVSLLESDGQTVLSRAVTGADGQASLHAPPRAVKAQAFVAGAPTMPSIDLAPEATSAALQLLASGTLVVHARDAADDSPLPVRVQVIPTEAEAAPPAQLGLPSEQNGRLHQDFAVTGESRLLVPPGEARVIVSRGYEWELLDQTVTLTAGATTELTASLVHSVDSTGVMCADFHLHSFYSFDSHDPVETKVKAAIADGLEIPVSSEHEWVVDFQPIIQALGLTRFAFGFPSSELTTATWGHFGVIPIQPREEAPNRGAIDWFGRPPAEVFDAVHALPEQPVLVVNHPSTGDFLGYFTQARFDRETTSGDPELWSDRFDAVEVLNASSFDDNRDHSVADWFALLDAGKIRWAVGNSDSHHVSTDPIGYPRNCFTFGHDDPRLLTADLVRDQLAAGASVISGGLFMTVAGPGGVGPGAMLPPQNGGAVAFEVTVQAPSWLQAAELEVLVDGKTADTIALVPEAGAGPAHVYHAPVVVIPTESRAVHYVVFHARGQGDLSPLFPTRAPFALSNPIFF